MFELLGMLQEYLEVAYEEYGDGDVHVHLRCTGHERGVLFWIKNV